MAHGFPEDELKKATLVHPRTLFGLKGHNSFHHLDEGHSIDVGDYRLRPIETPGHSPCHVCLYEADKKILFSGDHVLLEITPKFS